MVVDEVWKSGEDFGEDVGGLEGGESGEVDGVVAEEAVEEAAAVGAGEAVVTHVGQGDAGEECEEACLFRGEDVAVQGVVDYRNAGAHIKTVAFFIAGKIGCNAGNVKKAYEKPDVEVC